jgi:hypothetical protein
LDGSARFPGTDVHRTEVRTDGRTRGYLQQFPFDILKVDQSFIALLGEHNEQTAPR